MSYHRQLTHALSNSCSLSVFPTASGLDNGSRSAKRLNQAVKSLGFFVGSGKKHNKQAKSKKYRLVSYFKTKLTECLTEVKQMLCYCLIYY